jgi:hypothetical protein
MIGSYFWTRMHRDSCCWYVPENRESVGWGQTAQPEAAVAPDVGGPAYWTVAGWRSSSEWGALERGGGYLVLAQEQPRSLLGMLFFVLSSTIVSLTDG